MAAPDQRPLSVEEATTHILADFALLGDERIGLEDALGRVLAAPLTAAEDQPSFANSSMDGYAVRAADIAPARADHAVTLAVIEDIPAGAVPAHALEPGQAARIMTGAPMPTGADAVIPVEDTDAQWRGDRTPMTGEAALNAPSVRVMRAVRAGDYVRARGEDMRAGEQMLPAGTPLRAAEIGLLAALGQAQVAVVRQPRVAILSSGDELTEIDQPLLPGQIRNSNAYTLAALVQTYGGIPIRIPTARDTLDSVRASFDDALSRSPDVLLSSAGVSVGAFDPVRAVLAERGEITLWRINIRPGKPLAYGRVGGIPFFGLPGNPVSAQVTFDLFVRPALLTLAGLPTDPPMTEAALAHDLPSDGRRSYIRVILEQSGGRLTASATGTQSSGALSSMVRADGLLILPEGITQAQAGQVYPVRLLRPHLI